MFHFGQIDLEDVLQFFVSFVVIGQIEQSSQFFSAVLVDSLAGYVIFYLFLRVVDAV